LGAKLRLIVYDDKNDAKEAVAAFQRLVEVDRVVAVVGLDSSGIAAAVVPKSLSPGGASSCCRVTPCIGLTSLS
jgi:ABC-type branched-subunit amino acid transport system substrate-binding protein